MKNKIEKTAGLVQQALSSISNENTQMYADVKMHLKQALKGLDKIQQKANKKKNTQNQFEQWWGNVQSGVANSNFSNMSKEAQLNSLYKINNLINVEQNKIDELESKISPKINHTQDQELLTE